MFEEDCRVKIRGRFTVANLYLGTQVNMCFYDHSENYLSRCLFSY